MRKKITLDNRTEYRSDDILRIANAVMLGYHKAHATPETLRLKCIYRRIRDGFCGGYAYYNDNLVILKLSKDVDKVYERKEGDDQAMNIARTILHELAHCRGLRHGDMRINGGHDSKFDVEYVRGFPVRMKAETKPAPAPTDQDKVAKLQARRKRWTAKVKRAETAIKKIDRALRYYERKAQQPEVRKEAA